MRTLVGIWRALRLAAHLLTGAALTAVFGGDGGFDTEWQRYARLTRWWHGRLCSILGVDIAFAGRPVDGGALFVANHISWIDIPALGALTTTAFVSKAEVRRWPLIGWLAAVSGTVFIERGCHQYPEVSARITGYARQGRRVVLFPEGTTTEGRSVRPFHPRLLAPAIEEALPVQPVALRYSDARGEIDATVPFIGTESFLHHLWRVLRERGVRVEVTFCPALVPPHAARRRLADAAREAINATLYPLPTAHSEAVIELPVLATKGA